MRILIALLSSLIFGLGLVLSGMANPAKVTGFLDITGLWDPSLALVMGGAIAVAFPAFAIARRRTTAYTGAPMQLPANNHLVDQKLLIGGVLFGVGWGLAGICPGPALVLLGAGVPQGVVFVVAMLAGMLLYRVFNRPKSPS